MPKRSASHNAASSVAPLSVSAIRKRTLAAASTCFMICATTMTRRVADACSASSAPKLNAMGCTSASAALRLASSVRRCARSAGGSSRPSIRRIALWIWLAFSRTWVWASDMAWPNRPARAVASASFSAGSDAAPIAAANSGASTTGARIASSRPRIRMAAMVSVAAGSAFGWTGRDLWPAPWSWRGRSARPARRRRPGGASWACSRASCSDFMIRRRRSVSHQPISVRPSVS